MTSKDFGVGTRRSAFSTVEVDDGNFNYGDRLMIEMSQKSYRDFWIRPVGGVVNQSGPFTFNIEPMVDRYVQFNKASIEMVVRIVKADGSNLSMWNDIVAPVNLFGPCMWESINVSLNGKPFSGASAINAGYKAFLETMLSYDSDARNTHLNAQYFHLDSPGEYGNMTLSAPVIRKHLRRSVDLGLTQGPQIPADLEPDEEAAERQSLGEAMEEGVMSEIEKAKKREALFETFFQSTLHDEMAILVAHGKPVNKGFENRFSIVCGSEPFDMYAPITHDFFKLNNHVGPGNRVEIRLQKYPDKFLLNSYLEWDNYKIVIEDMKLHLRTIERRERVHCPLKEVYFMNETQVHKQIIAVHSPTANIRLFNGGIMPKTIILAMTSTKAFEGDYAYNPFNFHHYNVNTVALKINGDTYPTDGLSFDFAKENAHVSRGYHWMFENTGAADCERGNIVSWQAFQAGCFLIPFDLTPDKCNGLHNHNAEYGFIDLELSFDHPLNEAIYVVYEMVFPKVVINDKSTNTLTILDQEA
jgi:hypothetical protein